LPWVVALVVVAGVPVAENETQDVNGVPVAENENHDVCVEVCVLLFFL
jgi:hypothetical protein